MHCLNNMKLFSNNAFKKFQCIFYRKLPKCPLKNVFLQMYTNCKHRSITKTGKRFAVLQILDSFLRVVFPIQKLSKSF